MLIIVCFVWQRVSDSNLNVVLYVRVTFRAGCIILRLCTPVLVCFGTRIDFCEMFIRRLYIPTPNLGQRFKLTYYTT